MKKIERRMLAEAEEIFEIVDNAKADLEILIEPENVKNIGDKKMTEISAYHNALDLFKSARRNIEALEIVLKDYYENRNKFEEESEG